MGLKVAQNDLFCITSDIYLAKYPIINNQSEGKKHCNKLRNSEVCSKLTIKTPERRQWRRSSVPMASFWCLYC